MMTKENLKPLTEKITHLVYDEPHIQVKDVREFIRLLNEELQQEYNRALDEGRVDTGAFMLLDEFKEIINKLAGPELTQTPSGGSPQGDLLGKSNLSLRPADAHTQHKGDYARGINKIMHKDTQTQDEKTCATKGAKD